MPYNTLPFYTLLLAFSAQVFFVAASPVTWYPAPVTTTSSVPTSTPSRTIWYKADPTTSIKPSSSSSPSAFSTIWYKAPVSSSAAPATVSTSTSLPSFSGRLTLNGFSWCTSGFVSPFCLDKTEFTPLDVPEIKWSYRSSQACPNSTLPEEFLALPPAERALRGASLSQGFYENHGGLERFCGKQVKIINPLNTTQSVSFTVSRGMLMKGEKVGLTGPYATLSLGFMPPPLNNPEYTFEFL
ncbi:hypothetical protein JCM11251_007423 [Rhodosporidiobolus azoricus]